MPFNLNGMVVLITGGASGLGLRYAKELLRHRAKAITLADINQKFGEIAVKEIEEEFGKDKAIFVKTDVTKMDQFENAFKVTLDKFKNVDILFNNAGILNDATWQQEIAINVNGMVHGMLLGMDKYITKYKQGSEGLIVNMSSIGAIGLYGMIPIYCGTKNAIIAFTRNWGIPYHYERTKVKVVGICPGITATPMILEMAGRNLGAEYENMLTALRVRGGDIHPQDPEPLTKEVIKVIQHAENGSIWVIEDGEPAYQYIYPERETMKKNKIKN